MDGILPAIALATGSALGLILPAVVGLAAGIKAARAGIIVAAATVAFGLFVWAMHNHDKVAADWSDLAPSLLGTLIVISIFVALGRVFRNKLLA